MIDLNNEFVLTFYEAADKCPGGAVRYETVKRWADSGLRGVVLDAVRRGGRRFTSLEALSRFFRDLSSLDAPVIATSDERKARAAAALMRTKAKHRIS